MYLYCMHMLVIMHNAYDSNGVEHTPLIYQMLSRILEVAHLAELLDCI